MEPLLHILDWLVDHKVVGIPLASAIVVALTLLGFFMKRRRRADGPVAQAERGGKVQQTTASGIRAKGDIEISPRQE